MSTLKEANIAGERSAATTGRVSLDEVTQIDLAAC